MRETDEEKQHQMRAVDVLSPPKCAERDWGSEGRMSRRASRLNQHSTEIGWKYGMQTGSADSERQGTNKKRTR